MKQIKNPISHHERWGFYFYNASIKALTKSRIKED